MDEDGGRLVELARRRSLLAGAGHAREAPLPVDRDDLVRVHVGDVDGPVGPRGDAVRRVERAHDLQRPEPGRGRPGPDEIRPGVGDQQRAVGGEGDVHRVGERALLGAGHRLHAPVTDPPDPGVADVRDDERGVAVEDRGVRRAEARLRGGAVGVALLAGGARERRDGVARRAVGGSRRRQQPDRVVRGLGDGDHAVRRDPDAVRRGDPRLVRGTVAVALAVGPAHDRPHAPVEAHLADRVVEDVRDDHGVFPERGEADGLAEAGDGARPVGEALGPVPRHDPHRPRALRPGRAGRGRGEAREGQDGEPSSHGRPHSKPRPIVPPTARTRSRAASYSASPGRCSSISGASGAWRACSARKTA